LFKATANKEMLIAALNTAQIADPVIGQIRQEQIGSWSKLYCRNKPHSFYTNAIKACCLANNKTLAFFFMKKPRSIFKWSTKRIGCSIPIVCKDAAKEQALQVSIIMKQNDFILVICILQIFFWKISAIIRRMETCIARCCKP
jgi:hypothetical protein